MNDTALISIAATGFTVAFLHAAIPTHWIPFVLVGKARGWTKRRTLAITALAGTGHVLVTTALGFLIAWAGFELEETLEHLFPYLTSGVLLLVALYFGWRQLSGKGICHHHPPGSSHQPSADCDHGHDHDNTHWEAELADTALVADRRGDWAAIGGLFSMVTLSPCEGFLPIYLSGVQFGWPGFMILSGILAVATIAGMTVLTGITLLGSDRFRLERFERYEAGLLSGLFLVLAGMSLWLQHSH